MKNQIKIEFEWRQDTKRTTVKLLDAIKGMYIKACSKSASNLSAYKTSEITRNYETRRTEANILLQRMQMAF